MAPTSPKHTTNKITKRPRVSTSHTAFLESLGEPHSRAILSRRERLLEERRDTLWVNKRLTSKGDTIGYYLNPEEQENWAKRQVKGPWGKLSAPEKRSLREIRPAYLKAGEERRKVAESAERSWTITEGEMNAMRRMFEKNDEEKVSMKEVRDVMKALQGHAAGMKK